MSILTCHPAHFWIAISLWPLVGFAGQHGLDLLQMIAGVVSCMLLVNGMFAVAFQAARQHGRAFHPLVWWLAIFLTAFLHLLVYAFSQANGPKGVGESAMIVIISVFASMQLSFLWKHRPFRNPQSELPIQ